MDRKLTVSILIVFALPMALSAETGRQTGPRWLSITADVPSDPVRAAVIRSSGAGQEIAVPTPGAWVSAPSVAGGSSYVQLRVPGCGATADAVGLPEMPFKGFFLEIPYGVGVSVELLDDTLKSLGTGYRVRPLQPAWPDSSDDPPPFEINEAAYETDAFLPVEPVVLDEPGFIRGRRVVFVQVYPLRYNPATTELQAFTDMRFKVRYTGQIDPAGAARRQRVYHPDLEGLASGLLLNYESVAADQRVYTGRGLSNGTAADYLVIVKDLLYEEILPLANWKVAKGYVTRVVKTSQVGLAAVPTAAETESYIQTAYNTWDPAPSYVLLVGDFADIPPKWHTGTKSCWTDNPFACVSGSDYYPDLALGRLPVSTETDCTNVVNKILAYDKTPAEENWYSHFLSAGYFQDNKDSVTQLRDGEADRWFMETSAHVTRYFDNSLLFPGITTHTAWCTNSNWTGTYTYCSSNYPHRFITPPANVPAWVLNKWVTAAAATTAISTHINNGVGHVLHRDHGNQTAWGDPPYGITDINALTNAHKTPVVLSINCQTGSFHRSSGDCFCEAFLKKSPGGCVGIVGSTRISYSGYNDLLVHGMYSCMWSRYDSTYTDTTYSRSRRPAIALNYGKYYMMTYEGSTSSTTKAEFAMFHWFGDPEMRMRTWNPAGFVLRMEGELLGNPSGQMFARAVRGGRGGGTVPLADARVTLSHESGSDFWTGVVDANGEVTFTGVEFTEPGGYSLVVTGEHSLPYVEQFELIPGACCEDTGGSCGDGIGPLDCDLRWNSEPCGAMEALCGTGACCYPDDTCNYTPPWACVGPDEVWLGYGATCDACCILTCPPEGSEEQEACGDDMNGGCNMAEPAFEPIGCDETVCGTIWADGGTRDTDWYELTLNESQTVSLTLDAESPAVAGFVEQVEWGVPGCDNIIWNLVWYETGDPCVPISTASVCLPAGTYYVFVAPSVYVGYPCDPFERGNDYTLTVACEVCDNDYGACCEEDLSLCTDSVYELDCQGHGLRFLRGGNCVDLDPPCGSQLGVCCDDETRTCMENVHETFCQGYSQRFLASPATCDDFDPPCGTPWGVCCGPNPGDCTAGVYDYECQDPGTYFLAAPADCSDCETAVSGACCDSEAQTCEEGAYEFNCRDTGMRFVEDGTCADFDPPCVVAACPGDMDRSSVVDYDDIDEFVVALVSDEVDMWADVNEDESADGRDIELLIDLVLANGGSGTPCGTLPSGACCAGGACVATTTEADCILGFGGEWYIGQTCPEFQCPIVSNDYCETAELLEIAPGGTVSVIGNNTDGTEEYPGDCGDNPPNMSPPHQGVWYAVIGTGNAMTASTCNDDTDPAFDTKIQVWCGDCEGRALFCVTGNDDDTQCAYYGYHSTASWCTEDGQLYFILVGSFGAYTGQFELVVSDDGTYCNYSVECNATIGQCCRHAQPPYECKNLSQNACTLWGGYRWRYDLTCQSSCPVHNWGACCFDSVCVPLTQSACNSQGGTWKGTGTYCYPNNPCP